MRFTLASIGWLLLMLNAITPANGQSDFVPAATKEVVQSLSQATWQSAEDGLDILRAVTQRGTSVTAYRISPGTYTFDVELQRVSTGSRARQIGEESGSILAINGGFFAENGGGKLYPIGYLRLGETVYSKGWPSSGGLIVFEESGPKLLPTRVGIPKTGPDVLQTRPMLIEPGGVWAMGSNLGEAKPRSLFCSTSDGNIILVTVTRLGISLFEAGWMLRAPEFGGFFDCDAAVALDGGRSTQVWYSGDSAFSSTGFTPVQNFIVVRQREN